MESPGHALVVPVKRLAGAKSRLAQVTPVQRKDLALAFARDTLAAAAAAGRVAGIVVVTDEVQVRRRYRGLPGWTVVGDPGGGLNAAISRGTATAAARHPGLPVAVLMSDLPALRPEELDEALAEAQQHRFAFVADAEGIGTTLIAARNATSLAPGFGPQSAARHLELGAAPVMAPVPTLRRDVDTVQDIRIAMAMGTGRWTSRVASSLLDKPRAHAVGIDEGAFE